MSTNLISHATYFKTQSPPMSPFGTFDWLKLCSSNVHVSTEVLIPAQHTPRHSHHDPPGAYVELLDNTESAPDLQLPANRRCPF